MPPDEKSTRGRPPFNIDWAAAEQLLSIGCTDEEVATGLQCSVDALTGKAHGALYADLKSQCKPRIKLSVRRAFYSLLSGRRMVLRDSKGDPVKDSKGEVVYHVVQTSERTLFHVVRFLSKQYLGFSERTDLTTKGDKLPPGTAPGVLTIIVDDAGDYAGD